MTDLTVTNADLKLAASVHGPIDGEPILFLHGVSMCRDTWDEVAAPLKHRFRIWTLDFRGHGHSDHAASYTLHDYVSDAQAVLRMIGRPTILVGHSLGGVTAGLLAQGARPDVRAAFLEDPPWFLGEPGEWDRSVYPKLFAIVAERQAQWQRERAPFATWLDFAANVPSPMGGLARDHFSQRHLWSYASSLQRQDNQCWGKATGSDNMLGVIDTKKPFTCPVAVVAADPRCGAALLEGHGERLLQVNPQLTLLNYAGCGHRVHAATAFEGRFMQDLNAFIARV